MRGKSLSAERVAYLCLSLNEKQLNVSEIARKLKISRSCVYKYKKVGIFGVQKEKTNKGSRPKKLNQRDMRILVRTVKSLREREGAFTSKRLGKEAGIDLTKVRMGTVRRAMNGAGFKYLQARKKGILKKIETFFRKENEERILK